MVASNTNSNRFVLTGLQEPYTFIFPGNRSADEKSSDAEFIKKFVGEALRAQIGL